MSTLSPNRALIFPQFPMPFEFTSLNSNQIANKYYQNTSFFEKKGLKVYADDACARLFNDSPTLKEPDPIELDEVIIPSNRRIKEFEDFDLVLFTSTNGATLLQQYKQAKADPNELIVFLEINDGNNFFGSVMRIISGSNLKGKKNFPYADAIAFAQEKEINIPPAKIRKLIKKGIKSKLGIFSSVLSFISDVFTSTVEFLLEDIVNGVFSEIGDFFFKTIPNGLDKIMIDKSSWNPKDENFNPIFIPDAFTNYANRVSNKKNSDELILGRFIKPLFKKFESLERDTKKTLEGVKSNLPNGLYRKIKRTINYIFEKINDLEEFILSTESGFVNLLNRYLQAANALLSGLYNSVIDTLKGIFQIIGLVFNGIAQAADIISQPAYYGSLALEVLENIIEGILQVDYVSLFKQMILFPINSIKIITEFIGNTTIKIGEIDVTIEEVCYFLGYIIGFVVETAISIAFTGGTLSVGRALTATFKEPFFALVNIFKKGAASAKTIIDKIIFAINFVFKQLKNPKKIFDDFYNFIIKILKIDGKASLDLADQLKDLAKKGKLKLDEFADGTKRNKNDFTRGANFAEILSDQKWMNLKKWNNGVEVDFVPLHDLIDDIDRPIRAGIDGIFENKLFNGNSPPPKYIINEVKYNSKTTPRTPNGWKSKLSKTRAGKQMGDRWLEERLTDRFGLIDGWEILDNSYSVLTGVSKDGGKIEIFTLKNDASKIKGIKL